MSVDKWEQRMLCPDGACVGVIGMNGTCKVCGTAVPNWGDPRKPGRVSSKAEDDLESDEEAAHDEDETETAEAGAEDAAAKRDEHDEDDIAKRKLCPDGACVGVIGANGKCKVCGKAADGSASAEEDDEYEDDEGDDDEAADGDDDDDKDGDGDGADDDGEREKAPATAKVDQPEAGEDNRDNRALCPDGACVGLIGDDGKCKVCGKAAA